MPLPHETEYGVAIYSKTLVRATTATVVPTRGAEPVTVIDKTATRIIVTAEKTHHAVWLDEPELGVVMLGWTDAGRDHAIEIGVDYGRWTLSRLIERARKTQALAL